MSAIGRRYAFPAQHSLPGVEGYDSLHHHLYTVEVVAEGEVGEGGMIVDTAAIDAVMEPLVEELAGTILNESVTRYGCSAEETTVENLARMFRGILDTDTGELDAVTSVTVWEDDTRWGRSEA